jgi:peptide deformylase
MDELGYYFLPVIAVKPRWNRKIPSFLNEECNSVDLENLDTLEVLSDVIFEMFRTMYATYGVGLAAPQVGISWQLAVIDTKNSDNHNSGCIILINPEIVETYDGETESDQEGCLCVPFYRGKVYRQKKIRVKNYTLTGEVEFIEAEGFFARVIQHEMDHLKGKLYIDDDRIESLDPEEGGVVTSGARRSVSKLKVKKILDKRIKELSSENSKV